MQTNMPKGSIPNVCKKGILFCCILAFACFVWGQSEKASLDDVKMLSDTIGGRHPGHYGNLEKAEQYIKSRLQIPVLEFTAHTYMVGNKNYTNLVFEKKGEDQEKPMIIFGAHYDTVPDVPGADDNASGVSILISLAHILSSYKNAHTIQFVFFTLEEPPFFRTEDMGSLRYAKMLAEKGKKVKLVICVDMAGFYSDEEIQKYPLKTGRIQIPAQGNFVSVTSNIPSGPIATEFVKKLTESYSLPTVLLVGYSFSTGLNLSDHASFWEYGYSALIVSDTGPYRNDYYHSSEDTYSTLDYKKMALLTKGLSEAMQKMDRP